MKTNIDPKVDYAFKHVFGREASKPALISLLDAVLRPAAGQDIASLDLLNPFNDKEFPDDKSSVLDIKARDQSGRQFNVEMQMFAFGVFRQRALYYWSRLHQAQLKKGKPVARRLRFTRRASAARYIGRQVGAAFIASAWFRHRQLETNRSRTHA